MLASHILYFEGEKKKPRCFFLCVMLPKEAMSVVTKTMTKKTIYFSHSRYFVSLSLQFTGVWPWAFSMSTI